MAGTDKAKEFVGAVSQPYKKLHWNRVFKYFIKYF